MQLMQEQLLRAWSSSGATVLMVTHEADMAAYAHRTVRLVDGLIASDERRTPGGQP